MVYISLELFASLCDFLNSFTGTHADTYTKLTSMKTFRELEKLPRDQQRKLITQVLKETLPAAKDDILVDKIRPLLYQNGVITDKEATELFRLFTGEEKITKLYTEMLPKKGQKGLKKYMDILCDTGWDTPSHMRHHGVLLINLSVSEKLASTIILCTHFTLHYFRKSFQGSRVLSQYLVSTRVKRLQ